MKLYMTFFSSSLLLLFFFSTCSSTSSSVSTSDWGTPPGTITAIGSAGSPNEFTFEKWRFTKAEVPNGKVENIQIALDISTASLTTSWKDLEQNIRKKPDYFNVSKFPLATVSIDGATANGDGKYSCDAVLTLKGVSKTVPLTFTISDAAPYQVKGEGVIFRSNFKFSGNGPEEEVPLSFDVVLP